MGGEQRVVGKGLLKFLLRIAANEAAQRNFRVNFLVSVTDDHTTIVRLPDSYMWGVTVLELVHAGLRKSHSIETRMNVPGGGYLSVAGEGLTRLA